MRVMTPLTSPRSRARRRRDEVGTVALLVAAGMTALLVVSAMVLDFGLVRLDRQKVRQAMDSAVMAGLRAADDGRDKVLTHRAVCGALDFLRGNEPTLSGLSTPATCNVGAADLLRTCNPDDPYAATSASSYTGNVTSGNIRTTVTIKMPYNVSDGGYAEEGYASVSGDTSTNNGCDQLAVLVTRHVRPGIGSLATSSDLTSNLRSVGRVLIDGGDLAPALLLLERADCNVLTVGSGGSPSRVKVYGSSVQPALIHSDSAATGPGCGSGSNQQVFLGKQNNGIVAYGGPGGASGLITSFAKHNGVSDAVVSDGITKVYGSTAIDEFGSGTTGAVTGRDLVTRRSLDEHYLAALRAWSQSAYAEWTKSPAAPAGYTRYGCPSAADMTAMAAMGSGNSVYIDCPTNAGITLDGTIGAGNIYFHGFIKSGKLRMPNAANVYIDNTDNSGARINSDAITLGNNNGFCMRSTQCDSVGVGSCSLTPTTVRSQARLAVRRGALTTTGGLLRLCNTTVLLQGGQLGSGTPAAPGGCLPTTTSVPPTSSPCPGASSASGNGFVNLAGQTDWTAPNRYGAMAALGMDSAAQSAAWSDLEDLALWTETFGTGSSFKMAGNGALRVGGTFASLNAHPLTLSGGGVQDLTNAQFVTRSFAVDGGATLTMRVHEDAVAIPRLGPFLLVR